jgi:GrpB-like predicted nucleotidyltransferase (UPF0157 family)
VPPAPAGPVELHPHSAEWAAVAAREGERLVAALGEERLVAVHHIGSTSIPGIRAKPVVDLVAEVRNLAALDEAADLMRDLGYRWWGEHGIPGRRYCTLHDATTGRRLVHLHCYAAGSPRVEGHLAFRDYLRARPERAKDYEAEKLRCRALWPDDRRAYTAAKSAWIDAVEREALACRPSGRAGSAASPKPRNLGDIA